MVCRLLFPLIDVDPGHSCKSPLDTPLEWLEPPIPHSLLVAETREGGPVGAGLAAPSGPPSSPPHSAGSPAPPPRTGSTSSPPPMGFHIQRPTSTSPGGRRATRPGAFPPPPPPPSDPVAPVAPQPQALPPLSFSFGTTSPPAPAPGPAGPAQQAAAPMGSPHTQRPQQSGPVADLLPFLSSPPPVAASLASIPPPVAAAESKYVPPLIEFFSNPLPPTAPAAAPPAVPPATQHPFLTL
ncbi:hypothetical protein PAPYR_444 [Paratrimastix pyriformis]|uniref:Uncharacterized protein n=1 Tax=Paratrimastix pyriformis TaxID=342808 RepID=A0ABQ8UX62_9EUKA|nr:hypothetical protein PAPYR_444 [Paratrimastix pyriformis]